MKSAEPKVAVALAMVQVVVLAIIVTILHRTIGAGPIVCGSLLIAGGFLALGELRALNYATVRQERQRTSRRSGLPKS
ncbi:MAG TPA: hypothetical protein VK789_28525 [Bryobacteraceae bacterium]|nr:hypothetical protein [Bryobacteraceae bacterium]